MAYMIKFLKKNLQKIILIAFILVLPALVFAGDGDGNSAPAGNLTVVNPIHSETLIELIQKILTGALKIGMPIIVLAIIYSGFLFVSAQGNSEKLNEAKRTLLYTLIGAAILLGSWGIALLITNTVTAL